MVGYAQVSSGDLAVAELLAARVYELAGVRVTWSGGAAATARPDGAFHVDVVLVPNDKAAGTTPSKAMAEQVFGRASRQTRRAYIFYNRLTDHAARTDVGVSRLLGLVLAHEVGHVLLGADSHSPSGIMRANWYGRMVDVPGFTAEQGTTMRNLLATATANGYGPRHLSGQSRDLPAQIGTRQEVCVLAVVRPEDLVAARRAERLEERHLMGPHREMKSSGR